MRTRSIIDEEILALQTKVCQSCLCGGPACMLCIYCAANHSLFQHYSCCQVLCAVYLRTIYASRSQRYGGREGDHGDYGSLRTLLSKGWDTAVAWRHDHGSYIWPLRTTLHNSTQQGWCVIVCLSVPVSRRDPAKNISVQLVLHSTTRIHNHQE